MKNIGEIKYLPTVSEIFYKFHKDVTLVVNAWEACGLIIVDKNAINFDGLDTFRFEGRKT